MDFWPTWLAFWISLIVSLWGVLTAIPQNSTLSFLEKAPVETVVASAVTLSYSLVGRVFGSRIFSLRAVGVSIALSTFLFVCTFLIAAATTQWLWQDACVYFNNVYVPPEVRAVMNEYSVFGLGIVISGLIVEFLYLAKSRLILRQLNFESSYLVLAAWILGDICTTFALFVILMPIVIIAALYLLSLSDPTIDLTSVQFAVHGATDPSHHSYPEHFFGSFDLTALPSAYVHITKIFALEIWYHARSGFVDYHIMSVYPVMWAPTPKWASLTTGFYLPVTTMLATAFGTTIWVIATAMLLIIARFLCHSFVAARATFSYLHRHPHVIFWAGIFPSFLIMVIGGVMHEVWALLV